MHKSTTALILVFTHGLCSLKNSSWIVVLCFLLVSFSESATNYSHNKRKINFPSDMVLTIRTTDNASLSLFMKRNDDLFKDVPGYFIKGGKISRLQHDFTTPVEPYISTDLSAAFTVSCQWRGSTCKTVFAGDYMYKGKDYVIRPSVVPDSSTDSAQAPFHRVKRRDATDDEDGEPVYINYRPVRKLKRSSSAKVKKVIKIVLVLDYIVYSRFEDVAQTDANERDYLLLRHLIQILNGVDIRYRRFNSPTHELYVRLMGFFIAQTQNDSLWVEEVVSNGQVEARRVLVGFATRDRPRFLPSTTMSYYMHFVLLTGYDLIHKSRSSTLGYAYLRTACNYWSLSVVEDRGDMMLTMWIMAHEIGHSLGAGHDGRNNNCYEHDQFVMAPTFQDEMSRLNAGNHYIFSPCSKRSIITFINNLPLADQCFNGSGTDNSHFTQLSKSWDDLSGYQYTPDAQCQFILGQKSYLLRDHLTNAKWICSRMPCYDPQNPDSPRWKFAYDGTPCGLFKACQHGKCTRNRNIYKFSSSCPYGDQPGAVNVVTNLHCKNASDTLCKQSWPHTDFKAKCCKSCEVIKLSQKQQVCKEVVLRNGESCSSNAYFCLINGRVKSCCKICSTGNSFSRVRRQPDRYRNMGQSETKNHDNNPYRHVGKKHQENTVWTSTTTKSTPKISDIPYSLLSIDGHLLKEPPGLE